MMNNYAVGMTVDRMDSPFEDRVILWDDLDKSTAKSIARAKNKRNTNNFYFMVDWDQKAQEADEAFGRLVMAE